MRKYRNIVAFIQIVVNTNWAFPSFVEDTWLKSRAQIMFDFNVA